MKKYPNLFSPIKIGPLTAKNRIAAAPTSVSDLTAQGYLTRENIALYEMKAKGGAGIVTIGESYVSSHTGKAHGLVIPLYDENVLPSLIDATDAIKRHGSIASIELLHCGVRSHPKYCEDGKVYGPSAGINVYGAPIIEMDEDMIQAVADEFGDAAEMAKLGGADMCMIHGGHGWLIGNFLSPIHNQRKDHFGGSIENRARLALMIIDNIRTKCGKNFPIEMRISGSEFIDGGYTLEDSVEFAKLIDEKVDIINVSATSFHNRDAAQRMFPNMFLPRGCNVFLAEAVKKAVKVPVSTVGGLNDPAHMEEIISSGKADVVAISRGLLADPLLPEKARSGNADDIRPCLRCNHCISGIFVPYIKYPTRVSRCTVNPELGRELETFYTNLPTERKRVMIAGGGPGGMQAAITAADRGHEVLLFEKSDSLGGALNYATNPEFKVDLKKFKDYLIRGVNRRAVKVMFNTEVTPDLVKDVNPDMLIIAVGAKAIVPNIPGIENKKVIMANDIGKDGVEIGNKVVVIGGGLIGCEEGLSLAHQGKDVTIIEMQEKAASDCSYLHWRALMLELDKHEHVDLLTSTKCKKITDEDVLAVDANGEEKLFEADTIVIAVGVAPLSETVDRLRECDCKYMVLGDCLKPGKVLDAVHIGHFTAMNI